MAARVRYGPRTDEERAEALARRRQAPPVWSEAVNAVWETDPRALASVLPRPLEPPARPLVRATITRVDMAGFVFGAGYFAVAAVHQGRAGEYPLLMPMTSERAMTGGRETYGEPKKMGEVDVHLDAPDPAPGVAVHAAMGRLGTTLVAVDGVLAGAAEPPPERTKLDFYLKFLLAPDGKGFDDEPALVHCTKVERIRRLFPVDGEVTLGESAVDPVADLAVVSLVELSWQERSTDQSAEIVTRVPAEWVAPFVHQRYDDPLPEPGRG